MILADAALASAVLGTREPELVASIVGGCVRQATGDEIDAVTFTWESVGIAVGCRLAGGAHVVLKAFQPRWTAAFLGAARMGQATLFAAGIPVPEPLHGPRRVPGRDSHWVIDGWLHDPGTRPVDWSDARRRDASASGLARLIDALRPVAPTDEAAPLRSHPLRSPADRLWNEPHNPAFDFSLDPAGSAWIDEVAAAARQVKDHVSPGLAPVIAHCDWAQRNIRFTDDGALAAVYDCDSLALLPEAEAVGLAACTWAASGRSGDRNLADPGEVAAYVASYEGAVGRTFTVAERRLAAATAVQHVAYVARLEHALTAAGRVDADRPFDTARSLLPAFQLGM